MTTSSADGSDPVLDRSLDLFTCEMLERRPVRALLAAVVLASCGATERHCRTDDASTRAAESTRGSDDDGAPDAEARTDADRPAEQTSSAGEARQSDDGEPAADPLGRFERRRHRMVRRQIEARDITDERILRAMKTVPRHRFVPAKWRPRSYADSPLPIGYDQTISQPYIVAYMTQALDVDSDDRVFEVGTGSGYQAAILGELADEVYSVEIVCDLAEGARATLREQGYDNVHVECADGYEGWPAHAPFDRIILTAAPDDIPDTLIDQLEPGGRLVAPVGEHVQQLRVLQKDEEGSLRTHDLMQVRFVPMVKGEQEERE